MDRDQLIYAVIDAPKSLQNVDFAEIVQITSGHRIIPLDIKGDSNDEELFNKITTSAKDYIELCRRTRRRLQGNRINEVGKAIEEEFVQELDRKDLNAEILRKSGYPDIKIIDNNGRITYLESKATSRDWDSSLRTFYYTSGKKINGDARHLLIGWKVNEERDKYWEVIGCQINDLSKIKLKLKSEFNADNKELYSNTLYEY